MDARPDLRISDADRQLAAERLRLAVDEGRLDLLEYDRRLGLAYQADTAGQLAPIVADLPVVAAAAPAPAPRPAAPTRPMSTALRVLWTIWGSIMAINLAVWVLVSVGSGPVYFWPMWTLVPAAILGVVTVSSRR